jgi:hypothetical protein
MQNILLHSFVFVQKCGNGWTGLMDGLANRLLKVDNFTAHQCIVLY